MKKKNNRLRKKRKCNFSFHILQASAYHEWDDSCERSKELVLLHFYMKIYLKSKERSIIRICS